MCLDRIAVWVKVLGPPMPSRAKAGIFPSQVPKSHPGYIQEPAVGTAHYFTGDQAALGRYYYSHSEGGSTPLGVARPTCTNARTLPTSEMSLWMAATTSSQGRTKKEVERCHQSRPARDQGPRGSMIQTSQGIQTGVTYHLHCRLRGSKH